MPRLRARAVAAALAAGLAGCAPDMTQGRLFERRGEHHYAYESYARLLQSSPSDGAATEGLRRTAPRAAQFWQQQAYAAAEDQQWVQAAQCYLKVLQIRPDDPAGLQSLRGIARDHPQEMAQAKTTPLIVELPPVQTLAQVPEQEGASGPSQTPEVRYEASSAAGDYLLVVRLSRKDRRFRPVAALAAGLTVKLLDTEDQRDRATLEIYSEGKRLGKFRKLPRDSVITVLAADGAWYEVVVMSVSRQTQSVTVGLRAVG